MVIAIFGHADHGDDDDHGEGDHSDGEHGDGDHGDSDRGDGVEILPELNCDNWNVKSPGLLMWMITIV